MSVLRRPMAALLSGLKRDRQGQRLLPGTFPDLTLQTHILRSALLASVQTPLALGDVNPQTLN